MNGGTKTRTIKRRRNGALLIKRVDFKMSENDVLPINVAFNIL